jgi:uncharacterized protein
MSREPKTQLLELDRDECLKLLATTHLGRVAVNVPDWPPLIRPVNYIFDDRSKSVIFRSGRGSKFHALTRTQRAAFEVDADEPDSQTAWSVIVVGPVEEITDAAELARLEHAERRPWLPLNAAHWMRIRTTAISGRRIGPGSR